MYAFYELFWNRFFARIFFQILKINPILIDTPYLSKSVKLHLQRYFHLFVSKKESILIVKNDF